MALLSLIQLLLNTACNEFTWEGRLDRDRVRLNLLESKGWIECLSLPAIFNSLQNVYSARHLWCRGRTRSDETLASSWRGFSLRNAWSKLSEWTSFYLRPSPLPFSIFHPNVIITFNECYLLFEINKTYHTICSRATSLLSSLLCHWCYEMNEKKIFQENVRIAEILFMYRRTFRLMGFHLCLRMLLNHCDSGIEDNIILFEHLSEKTKKIDFHVQNSTVFAHCSSDFYLYIIDYFILVIITFYNIHISIFNFTTKGKKKYFKTMSFNPFGYTKRHDAFWKVLHNFFGPF